MEGLQYFNLRWLCIFILYNRLCVCYCIISVGAMLWKCCQSSQNFSVYLSLEDWFWQVKSNLSPPHTHTHTLHSPPTHTTHSSPTHTTLPPLHTHTTLLPSSPLECPLCELDEYRVEALILLRGLERLDKDEYTEDERADAEEVHMSGIM